MTDGPEVIRFHVAIDYRTQRGLGYWSYIVPAISPDEAHDLAEKLLRRKRRAVVRIDRVVVR
jgi:hypothetical protein